MTPADTPSGSDQYTATGELRAGTLRERHQHWADQQVTTTACAFCEWTHEGTALEGREEAKAHREFQHPEACIRKPRRRSRITKQKLRTASEEEQIKVDAAEARRVRAEREEAQMLEKIERGRARALAAPSALDMATESV